MEYLSLHRFNNAITKSVHISAISALKIIPSIYMSSLKTNFNLKSKIQNNSSFLFTQTNSYSSQSSHVSNNLNSDVKIDVERWTNENYTPYEGDSSFLTGPSEKTMKLIEKANKYLEKESANNNIYDIDSHIPSTITSHKPGFLDKENEVIYGYQTDTPLKRPIKPFGGINMIKNALKTYHIPMDKKSGTYFYKL